MISLEAETMSLAELMDRLDKEVTATLSVDDVLDAINAARERRS